MDKLILILISLSATNRRKSDFMCFLTCVTSFLMMSFNTVSFLWCQIVQFFFSQLTGITQNLDPLALLDRQSLLMVYWVFVQSLSSSVGNWGTLILIFYTSTYTFFILIHFYTKFCVLLAPCKQMGGASVFVRDVHCL